MLKLEKGKRVIAIVLAIVTVIAAFALIFGLFDTTDKSNTDVLGATDLGSIKLASASASASNGVFTEAKAEQNDLNKITVSGVVNTAEYDGAIYVRVGKDVLHSLIFGVALETDGSFEETYELNATLCVEFDNVVPVTLCYGENELLIGSVGVVTYEYNSGILRYPVGASYIAEDGTQKTLEKPYAPTDAKKEDGKVTVLFGDKVFKFVPNPLPVAEAPEKGTDGVYDQLGVDEDGDGTIDYIKALLNTTDGRQYAISELSGSVDGNYGIKSDAWKDAEAAKEFANLVPGNKYSFWVRFAGTEGEVLPSAPIFIGSIVAMDSSDATAKNAFLEEYNRLIVDGGKTLYPAERVTATSSEILNLISLYNSLSDEIKAIDYISEKGEYLVLSNYLAKHQDIIAAAKTATAYNDLRGEGKFTYTDMTRVVDDFGAIYIELGTLHLNNTEDGNYLIDLASSVAKINVLSAVEANDAAKDKRYEAVAWYSEFMADFIASESGTLQQKYEYALSYLYQGLAISREEYNIILFYKKYNISDTDSYSAMSLETLEAAYAELKDVVVFDTVGNVGTLNKLSSANELYRCIAKKYGELIGNIASNGDTTAQEIIAQAQQELSALSAYVEAIDVETYGLTYPKEYYTKASNAVNVRLAYVDGLAKILALENGNDEIDALANFFAMRFETWDGVWNDVYNGSSDYETTLDTMEQFVSKAQNAVTYKITLDKAYSDVKAMKDGTVNVDAVANKYVGELDRLTYDENAFTALCENIADIVEKAKNETEFEKRRNSAKESLAAELAATKATGKYNENGIAQLDSILAAANVKIDNLDYVAGKTINDIDAQILEAIAEFKKVKVLSISFGNKGDELSGTVYNANGIVSSLSVSLSKSNDKTKLDGKKGSVVTGEFTDEKAAYVIDGKTLLLSIKLNISGTEAEALKENGHYIVKILLPKELRGETGLQVVTESGDTTYIYDTVRAGAYLKFTVTDISEEFYIIGDKTVNLLWLVILLAVLLVVEIVIIVYFIVKKRKGVTASAVAPIFAALLVSKGIVASIIALSVLSVIGAVAAVVLIFDYKKKNMM